MMLRRLLPEHGPQPLDHRARPVVALHDVGQDLAELIDTRRALRQEALRCLGIAQDGRQRLVQLVGQ